ncbi:Crp/Fnr family transcriptional regulator [Phenylobacterium terrae]|uniref:Crp/Fnr family transcriptional regulator n=1 Tax=Phenylobacterium terrae TaxID=2665495 RepID=A0ABW4MW95_9CAUL
MADRKDVSPPHTRLIAKLEAIGRVTEAEKSALADLPYRLRSFPENADLVRQGDKPPECCLIVEGFVCRYKLLGEGQRQIMSFHLPGDIPDLQSLHLRVMDHSLSALTPVTAAFIPHEALHALTRAFPGIAALFWRDTLIDAAIFREWLAGVGRRTAKARIAHVICEVYLKLRAVHLADDGGFDLPITQVELADALGLSPVHVNRVLQELRADGLIVSKGRFVIISDWERLRAVGDFDASYLHFRSEAA